MKTGITGVYRIYCTENSKIYIGSAAVCFRRRWSQHRHELSHGKHGNSLLQRAWDKYGEQSFTFSVIEICDPSDCIKREQFHIDSEMAANRDIGFNLSVTAGSQLGFRHSEESKKKMRIARTGRKASAETRKKMSKSGKGKRRSLQFRNKIRSSLIGRKLSAETKAKISAANLGRVPSERDRENQRKAQIGRVHSEQSKAKMSAIRMAWAQTPEAKAKMKAAWEIRKIKHPCMS